MRLDRFLAHTGYGTRKEVKVLLKRKCVLVNGAIITKGDTILKLDSDSVTVNDEVVHYQKFIYLMLNKPGGYLSATEDNHQQTVIDLLDANSQRFSPFPVGRLDKDTEGLLLLTNDGYLAHFLLSPKKQVHKTYYAKVAGVMDEADVKAFREGIILEDGYECLPANLEILSTVEDSSDVLITISEGKFHQIKRMVVSCGKEVSFLKRLTMGSLKLDENLKLGEYRPLTEQELNGLKEFLPQNR